MRENKIGIFDSGFGGLTIFKEIHAYLPQYDYVYLGDNSRAPYGPKSFDTVYHHTWQSVQWLIQQNCTLIILACNTASARALRTIQQKKLPPYEGRVRVLGVIRPTAEIIGAFTKTQHIGVLGTEGTIKSNTYQIEINNFFPSISVYQHACPLWVPFVEDRQYQHKEIDFFIKQDVEQLLSLCSEIDTILLGCTHYPLLMENIQRILPGAIKIISQGPIIASSLANYLDRHPEIETKIGKHSTTQFFTTDDPLIFEKKGSDFFGKKIKASHIDLAAI